MRIFKKWIMKAFENGADMSEVVSKATEVAINGKNHHEKMEDIMESLYDAFDEIYEYNQEAQIENFYRVLVNVLDEILL